MDIMFYLILSIIIGFGAYQIYQMRLKNKNITEVIKLAYETVEEITRLYQAKNLNKDEFAKVVIDALYNKIQALDIMSETDKKFWTEKRVEEICKPFVLTAIEKLDNNKK